MLEDKKLQDFLELFYQDSNIPAYLYREDQMIYAVPAQTNLTYPPLRYYEILSMGNHWSSDSAISYCSTSYGIYYGSIHLKKDDHMLIIFGPVNNIPYSDADLHQMYKDYVVSVTEQAEFLFNRDLD